MRNGYRSGIQSTAPIFRAVIVVCTMAALSVVAGPVLAEGRCPPGQYPIGDDRAPGCAPIPAGGGARNLAPRQLVAGSKLGARSPAPRQVMREFRWENSASLMLRGMLSHSAPNGGLVIVGSI